MGDRKHTSLRLCEFYGQSLQGQAVDMCRGRPVIKLSVRLLRIEIPAKAGLDWESMVIVIVTGYISDISYIIVINEVLNYKGFAWTNVIKPI